MAVWESEEDLGWTIGIDRDILTSHSTDNGLSWSAPQALNTNANSDSGDDISAQVTTDGLGHWVAVWSSLEDLGGTIGTDLDILVCRSGDNGASWSSPQVLNGNADWDSGNDLSPQVTTDGSGNWVAVWQSNDDLDGTISADWDILVSRSTDNGATWSVPQALNTNAASDDGYDYGAQCTTNGAGNWVAVWYSAYDLGGTIGADDDILVSRSTDNGLSWSSPQALNTNAASDAGRDASPQVTTDGLGNWVAVWHSSEDLSATIGTDWDILVSRSTDNGLSWSAPQALHANANSDSGNDGYSQVMTDGLDNWVAVWQSYDDLGGTIGIDADILVARFALVDCNGNGVVDAEDIAGGTSADCDGNGVPDECQLDSDEDGIIDACEAPCSLGATSAVLMSFWTLCAAKLARRRRARARSACGTR